MKALRRALPKESFIYLGDSARLPYGTKSKQTVIAYAKQASEILMTKGIKALVVACNTASGHALDELSEILAPRPVIGVCLLYTSPSPRDTSSSRMPSSA